MDKVAQELIKKRKQLTLAKEELTIKKVVDNIKKLAGFEGQGTVDKKVKLVSELLNSAEPEEARFIVATILEELRVGVASGIIRDALAKVFNTDVELIEKAYNLTTDYGDVAELLKQHGLVALNKISLKPGIPIKSMLAVLVLSIEEAFEALGKPAQLEEKLDGFRVQISKDKDIKIFTRNLEDVTKQFPDIIEYIKENVLKKFNNTGVQKILNTIVFDVLKYKEIFPGGLNNLKDKDGNVLPDCFLLPENSTALDFAFKLHTDIGKGFIKAILSKSSIFRSQKFLEFCINWSKQKLLREREEG